LGGGHGAPLTSPVDENEQRSEQEAEEQSAEERSEHGGQQLAHRTAAVVRRHR